MLHPYENVPKHHIVLPLRRPNQFNNGRNRVLVRTLVFERKHKLAGKWEEDIHIVVKHPNPDIPVYVVEKENGSGRSRTLHRNLLLPIGSLSQSGPKTRLADTEEKGNTGGTDRPRPIPRPRPRPRTRQSAPISITKDDDSDSDTYSDSSQWCAVAPGDVENVTNTIATASDGDVVHVVDDAVSHVTGDDQSTGEIGDVDSEGDAQFSTEEDSESHHSETATEAASDTDTVDTAAEATSDTDTVDTAADGAHGTDTAETDRADTVETDISADVQTEDNAQDQSSPTQDIRKPPARTRKQPQWMTSGDFALAQIVHQPEWIQKAEYISALIHSGLCADGEMRQEATRTILSIISR